MKSKLTFKACLFPLLAIALIISSAVIITDHYPFDFFKLRWIDYFMTILFLITLVWLIKFEILRKMILIEVKDRYFVCQNIIFNKRNYEFNDLIGYKTQVNLTKLGTFEETIILVNDESKIILSEFFIDNYKELKIKLTSKLTDYGGARKNAL